MNSFHIHILMMNLSRINCSLNQKMDRLINSKYALTFEIGLSVKLVNRFGQSRCTIAVLSKNFLLQSKSSRMAVRAVHKCAFADRHIRMIIIIIHGDFGDINEQHADLEVFVYVRISVRNVVIVTFFDKLRHVLPYPLRREQNNSKRRIYLETPMSP